MFQTLNIQIVTQKIKQTMKEEPREEHSSRFEKSSKWKKRNSKFRFELVLSQLMNENVRTRAMSMPSDIPRFNVQVVRRGQLSDHGDRIDTFGH